MTKLVRNSKENFIALFFLTGGLLCIFPAYLLYANNGPYQGPCSLCSVGWINTSISILGGIECQHGPEYDKVNCDQNNPDCCETKPGGCTGASGECRCFSCYGNSGCETEIEIYVAYCGFLHGGSSCDVEDDVEGVVRRQRKTKLKDGLTACTGTDRDQNGVLLPIKYFCGGLGEHYGNCVSNSCESTDGSWRNINGMRTKCKYE